MKIEKNKTIHFTGIGGIGMSAIAIVLLEMGYRVSGSDLESSNLTKRVEALGGRFFKGHSASNIPGDAGLLVYSSAVSKINPELVEAKRRKMRIAHRAEVLGYIFNPKKGIAVTGTHGKTTTSSIISFMLERCGLDPTVAIGGEVDKIGGNAKRGSGKYFVAEADESDGSFINLHPFYAVVTNIEPEHMDHYKTLGEVNAAYRAFIGNAKKRRGAVFYNYDDPDTKKALAGFKGRTLSFGFSSGADMRAENIIMDRFNTTFDCVYEGRRLGDVALRVPGRHNVLNALAAILVGLEIGLDFRPMTSALEEFDGVRRRFQLRAESGGVMLIDDYAHHPTEIRAVLDACSNWKGRRVIAVFQPHRYTRTKFLAEDFGQCFNGADKLILTDIYAASEKPLKGISAKTIHDRIKSSSRPDVIIMKKDDIVKHVMAIKRSGDIVLVMGAGDIKKVADELCRLLLVPDDSSCGSFTGIEEIIRGKMIPGEPLSRHSSFKIGGKTGMWAEPDDAEDLRQILKFTKKNNIPVIVMGNGTNILASDTGFKGIIIHLGAPFFKAIKINGLDIRVGAGFGLPRLVSMCCDKGLGGIESLVGIPGSVGGAIFMNAGGYANPIFRNIGERVKILRVMDYDGKVRILKKKEIEFGYRGSNLGPFVILEAEMKLYRSDNQLLNFCCKKFLDMKKEKQVLDLPSAGCIFKNPKNFQFTCGQMIDMLGLKGKRIGGAEISEKHANFIVNRDGATSEDVMGLIKFVTAKVKDNYGVLLELEVKIV